MKTNIYIILLYGIIIILLILLMFFILSYRKDFLIKQILNEWKNRVKSSNIDFDAYGDNINHYYLNLRETDYDTHIHLITDSDEYYLCYIIKKNGKHSPLYIIDPNKDVHSIVDEMINNFYKYK